MRAPAVLARLMMSSPPPADAVPLLAAFSAAAAAVTAVPLEANGTAWTLTRSPRFAS